VVGDQVGPENLSFQSAVEHHSGHSRLHAKQLGTNLDNSSRQLRSNRIQPSVSIRNSVVASPNQYRHAAEMSYSNL
jgi:hypothetical protein